MLAIIVGSAVISIGVGGIAPMRSVLERLLGVVQREGPAIRTAAAGAPQRAGEQVQSWQQQAGQAKQTAPEQDDEHRVPETPRFPTQP
jgi:hypothetical protein